ncbi:MAG: hypothetical protein IJP76_09630 [Paludibacteraceae bacterium]|nr:hypothetical protein [Paludibacteraceae bacterium]MBQ9602645.1 hypothetical protein [Paludibacteraceae bacterium]
MYKKLSVIAVVVLCTIAMSSCRSALSVIPQATNTIAPISFGDLDLQRKDYIILNTISAEATLTAHFSDGTVKIDDPSGEFSLTWEKDKKTGEWSPDRIKGIVRLGYLSNDYDEELFNIPPYPHWIVRRLAIYRLINAAKIAGGDGVIEPLISTNVEQGKSNRDIVYKTTVSAKLIKIKTDSK